jgi:hypothetical protein
MLDFVPRRFNMQFLLHANVLAPVNMELQNRISSLTFEDTWPCQPCEVDPQIKYTTRGNLSEQLH